MDLSGDCDLIQVLILQRPVRLVRVIKYYRYCRLCHTRLPLFVYKLLQAIRAHLQLQPALSNPGVGQPNMWMSRAE